MAVLPMKRISLCAAKSDRKAILETIQRSGVMEVSIEEDVSEFKKVNVEGARAAFERESASIEQALEILSGYAPEKTSLLSSLAGKQLVAASEQAKIQKQREELKKVMSRIIEDKRKDEELNARLERIAQEEVALGPWKSLEVPLNTRGTAKTRLIFGTLPVPKEGVDSAIFALPTEDIPFNYEILSVEDQKAYIAVICLKKDKQAMTSILKNAGFLPPVVKTDLLPLDQQAKWDEEKEEIAKKKDQIKRHMIERSAYRESLKILSDDYRIRAEKYAVLAGIPHTDHLFALEGYATADNADRLREKLEKNFTVCVECETLTDEDEAPVVLKNNAIGSMGEGVVGSFGMPGKGEIDPSFVMTICYVILFGIMLSDAGYGLIVSLACGVVLLKFPRMEENMRKSIRLFFWCGISTLIWGLLFGGFFGDAVDVIAKTFFGVELAEGESLLPALWFVPLNDPMKMLVYSMLFGIIHLFLGLIMKGIQCVKTKDWGSLFVDVVCWMCLITGLVLIFIPTDMFGSISGMSISLPDVVNKLALGMTIGGAAGILLFSGRGRRNIGLRLALGAYDLYGATSWLSDILSYSRLLALGLATGVIAQVINMMGAMMGKTVPGVIVFVLVFVFGHILNLLINLLGAYVHTCRLQYVEFFGKFYNGGGKAFVPFKQPTKYVDIKEEN